MGEMILCKRQIAATPFYLDELSMNVYSLEELSYYIFHNVYLLNADFMSVDLCNWIGRELGMKELSDGLLELVKENVPLHIFVGRLLHSCGYLTLGEVKDTLAIISVFENKSEAECKKIRADRLMEKNRLVDAIYEYESLIDGDDNIGDTLLGDIRHNLGSAYAKLFFFTEAAESFEQAYRKNHRRVSLRSMLIAYYMAGNLEDYSAALHRYQVSNEEDERIREEVDHLGEQSEARQFEERLEYLRADYSEQSAYVKQLSSIVDDWKKDYARLCRM
ncbi:MAG: hypothetical protein IJT32_02810 [Lachnospiraceae bacterium]|nr:hypothetical protein [Lachnospiraceae bacterium]